MAAGQTPGRRIGLKARASNAHVGAERAATLTKMAIELSVVAQRQITSGQFLKYLIDHYAGPAKDALKAEFQQEAKGEQKA